MHTVGVPMARGGCGCITGNGVSLGTAATSSWRPIVTVIRCSVGAPSECRDASASLTCACCMNPKGMSIRGRMPEICGLQVVKILKNVMFALTTTESSDRSHPRVQQPCCCSMIHMFSLLVALRRVRAAAHPTVASQQRPIRWRRILF